MEGIARRRSRRTSLAVPVIVTARTPEGVRIETSGETLDVNEHGARVRTLDPLPEGSRLRVAIIHPYRWRAARVVRVNPGDDCECGIELEHPGEFWGMYFPADEWAEEKRQSTTSRYAAVMERKLQTAEPAPSAAPAAPEVNVDPLLVLLAGTEVGISAMSLVRTPFNEQTIILGVDEGSIVLQLRRVVNPGSRCQLAVRGLRFRGIVSKVTQRPVSGRWGVWIKL